jgi:hypothetical protein
MKFFLRISTLKVYVYVHVDAVVSRFDVMVSPHLSNDSIVAPPHPPDLFLTLYVRTFIAISNYLFFNLHILFYTNIILFEASRCTWHKFAAHWLRTTDLDGW